MGITQIALGKVGGAPRLPALGAPTIDNPLGRELIAWRLGPGGLARLLPS